MIDFGTVLFVGAHPDDLVSSCGGIIQKLIKKGKESLYSIYCLCFTHGDTSRMNEYYNGMFVIGVKGIAIMNHNDTRIKLSDAISQIDFNIKRINIDSIFTHWYGSIHQDHRVVSEACRIAVRKKDINLIYYEDYRRELSNFSWKPNLFVRLTKEELDKKRKALYCHESQKGEWMEDILRDPVERFQISYLVIQ